MAPTTLHMEKISPENTMDTVSIFIVDDDQMYLSALGFRLMKENKHHSYKVYCYTSGEDCLRYLYLNPSVILLDYYLSPGNGIMNGLEVIRKIREEKPQIPVVIMSGQKSMNIALDTLKAGAYTYIIKDKQALHSVEKVVEELTGLHFES